MSTNKNSGRKSSIIQSAILGRVERLLGSSIDSNPFEMKSELSQAFLIGYSRSVDNPIIKDIQQGKKTIADLSKTIPG
jgi:hypothetical protein